MEPGCFSCCFSGLTVPAQKYHLSRVPPKKMMNLVSRKTEKQVNPQDTYYFAEKKNRKERQIQIPQLANLEVLRQKTYNQNEKKLHFQYLLPSTHRTSSPQSILVAKSGRFRQERPSSMTRSYLYGGAKKIINRMSNLEDPQSEIKASSAREHSWSIKDPFTLSHEFIQTKSLSKQLLDEFNPFNQITLSYRQDNKVFPAELMKMGKLLGRGKYCHVYMAQEDKTNCLYSVKYIFKNEIHPPMYASILKKIDLAMKMDHPSIVSTYGWSNDKENIIVVQQYTPTLLYHQIKNQKALPIEQIRIYLKSIIEGVIVLHQSNKAHGNLNPFQVGCMFGECKLRISLTNQTLSKNHFLKDIHSLALLGYEMSYGVFKTINREALLQDQLCYYEIESMRAKVMKELAVSVPQNKNYFDLNSFLLSLLKQEQNQRITGSSTLTHPFFTSSR